jgi:hypothetical protein
MSDGWPVARVTTLIQQNLKNKKLLTFPLLSLHVKCRVTVSPIVATRIGLPANVRA